jgi:hypothetical protein
MMMKIKFLFETAQKNGYLVVHGHPGYQLKQKQKALEESYEPLN